MKPNETETINELRTRDLRIVQPKEGYRFSLDPLLLCDFAETANTARIVDLGSGCGIIPLILARKAAATRIVGVEFQDEMAGLAARNVALNEGASVEELVTRLQAIGATARDVVSILQAIKAAGALEADLEVI